MLPKCSIVSIGVHSDILDWVARYKPTSIILVNERGQSRPERPWENNEIDGIRNAMGASPKTLWIFRSWPDGIQEGPDDWTLAARIWKCFEPFKDMHNPKMGHSFNEPGFPWIGASGDAERLAAMEEGFAKSMHDQGLLSMNFCFSESHILKGNMGLWSIYAEALPYVDALGFNEYDWPWVLTSRDQGYKWRIGHYEHQLLEISKHSSDIPPVIIGEGILDGKIQFPNPYGWQKRWKPEKYIEMHQQVYDDTYHRPEVFSHHTYCFCGPESEWRSYDVAPILPQLGQLIQNPVYWNDYVYPGVNKPDLPKKEEEPMSDELIRALDVSEYGGEIQESQWKAAYDAGYRMAIVQAWGGGPVPGGKNAYCARQLEGARRAGMMTAIYFHLPSDTTTKTELLIQAVKEAASVEYQYIKFVAVDIEGGKLLHPLLWEERLEDAISHIKDKPVVIYTSKNAWEVVMGGVDGFEDYPLWDAKYDNLPNLEANWKPYGGWTQRAIKQFKGTTIVPGGISSDLNTISLKRLGIAPEAPTTPLVPQSGLGDDLQIIDSAADVIKNTVAKIREGR